MSSLTASLKSGDPILDRAFRIALGDLHGNIQPYQDGLLERPLPCLMAGLDYDMPWTRDAAFNTWYAGAYLFPEAAKNTLLSVLTRDPDGTVRIGGQYWDAIIWVQGAWQYFKCTNDKTFLETAYAATVNSLKYFERTELDPADHLFRGGACFQDGVAGYPDFYAPKKGIGYSGILSWLEHAGDLRFPVGEGVPCKALSTNCLYYRAYILAVQMAEALGTTPDPTWKDKAENLRTAINRHFWNEQRGSYNYFVDAPGKDERQEGLGLAFALLFDVADDAQAKRIFASVYLAPQGIPCVWPSYERYTDGGEYGRHCGPIWPQVSAAWALACTARGRNDLALRELHLLAEKAVRDSEFIEVFHPMTGVPYGGLQEHHTNPGMELFGVCHRQSWCSSGYVAMVVSCLLGAQLNDRPTILKLLKVEA